MKHHNEYDITFQISQALQVSNGVRATGDRFRFDFHLPENPAFVYRLSFDTQHPEGLRALLNGRSVPMDGGTLVPCGAERLRYGLRNTLTISLPGNRVRFYGNLSVQVQYDRVNPDLPLCDPRYKALDLTRDSAVGLHADWL